MTRGVVVVLGKTGRNFAAGMSGGVAYVLDADGDFAVRCNTGMVDLDPLEPRDAEQLRALIERHRQLTQSAAAERILAAWPAYVERFVKVMPTEYRSILAKAHLDSESGKLASI
jgi:glutamate synthase domain-containing protein 3